MIQSLFLKIHNQGPTSEELGAYCGRLRDIVAMGGKIKLVQVYTVARKAMTVVDGVPAWQFVEALADSEVDAITERVRREAGLAAEGYYGRSTEH